MKLRNMIENNEGTIIDVRTPTEFQGGHSNGSINIPCMKSTGEWTNFKN